MNDLEATAIKGTELIEAVNKLNVDTWYIRGHSTRLAVQQLSKQAHAVFHGVRKCVTAHCSRAI